MIKHKQMPEPTNERFYKSILENTHVMVQEDLLKKLSCELWLPCPLSVAARVWDQMANEFNNYDQT